MSLPSGTVTFLFTDIEGSTRLWEQYPEQMQQAHARHGELIMGIVEQHGGTFVRTRGEGDSTFSVFAVASNALAACCAFQRALTAEPWPVEAPIRVRAALHTGAANLRDSDYNSTDVNRCARLRAIAHGGQTILSQTVYDLVSERLPEGVTLKDMGLHRLKDLSTPEHVWQLCHPDLPVDVPPLNSLDPIRTNLPIQATSFIGREKEMAEVKTLLSKTRLLTLTGSGGCGKTRLALQVAVDLIEEYADGVWLVELASLSNPDLVPQTVAQVLGIREQPGSTLLQTLIDNLKPKQLLLVLDNCEHLLPACAQLVDTILRSCAQVNLLTTSRERLRITGEQTYRVPSLSLPDPKQPAQPERLIHSEAVCLFIDRASLSQIEFALTHKNASAVASMCHHLDGIPLALELAAAHVGSMAVEEIESRLDHRFRLLKGSRTALPRHQTLHALIDWSYDLLSPPERLLLNRFSVFRGGWTQEAAERVCAGEDIEEWEVLDLLTSLVDKSLVVAERQESSTRYRLLETVRQYAWDRLVESGEDVGMRGCHRDYFVRLAEQAKPQLTAADQAVWLQRLEIEHDNLRSALAWCQADESGAESGLRLSGALWRFWEIHGHWSEGRAFLTTFLNRTKSLDWNMEVLSSRADAAYGAGVLAHGQGDYEETRQHFEESRHLCEETQDLISIARAFNGLGRVALSEADYPQARKNLEQSLILFEALQDLEGMAEVRNNFGLLAFYEGDQQENYVRACSYFEESLTLRRQRGDIRCIAGSLNNLGMVAYEARDFDAARGYYTEALELNRKLGNLVWEANNLHNLAMIAYCLGEWMEARALNSQSLALRRTIGSKSGVARSLYMLGLVAYAQEDYAAADVFFKESLTMSEELSGRSHIADVLQGLSKVACHLGNLPMARKYGRQSIDLYLQCNNTVGISYAIEAFTALAIAQGNEARAATLLGSAQTLRAKIRYSVAPCEEVWYDHSRATLYAGLGSETFAVAWAAGQAMTLEQAVAYALAENTE